LPHPDKPYSYQDDQGRGILRGVPAHRPQKGARVKRTRCKECGALYYVDGGYDDLGNYVLDYATMDGRSVENCEDCGADLDESAEVNAQSIEGY
jgi:hypothetical protein